ncbi:hypothetical protein P4133_18440 [Pseudomonas aeruginosa]|nr:hypothetical protein [Pseudomonas aeruginosa]
MQDAVRDLAVALSPNPEERITLLTARRQELIWRLSACRWARCQS